MDFSQRLRRGVLGRWEVRPLRALSAMLVLIGLHESSRKLFVPTVKAFLPFDPKGAIPWMTSQFPARAHRLLFLRYK